MSDKVCKQTSDCFRHAFHHVTAVGCDVLLALELASRFAYTPRRAGSLQRNGHVSFSMHVRIAWRCLDYVDTFHIFSPAFRCSSQKRSCVNSGHPGCEQGRFGFLGITFTSKQKSPRRISPTKACDISAILIP